VLRNGFGYWRRHFWFLTTMAAIVWLPLALLELSGVAHGIDIDTDHFDLPDILLNVLIVLVFELLATEVLAAASEKIVADDLHGAGLPTRREFFAAVPWVTLVLGTFVYEVLVTVGLVLFVFPGLVAAVWGVVTGPVIVAEGTSALGAPRRSRQLVRGSFWSVAVLVLIGAVASEIISTTAGELLSGLPHRWFEPTGEYVVHVLTTPLFGMVTAVLYYALVARERVVTRNEPAGAGSSS
jgi:hypothetical protein